MPIDTPMPRGKTRLVPAGLLMVIGLAACQGLGERDTYVASTPASSFSSRGQAIDAAMNKCRALGKHYEYIDESLDTGRFQVKFRCVSEQK
jgi:hypothetical protein